LRVAVLAGVSVGLGVSLGGKGVSLGGRGVSLGVDVGGGTAVCATLGGGVKVGAAAGELQAARSALKLSDRASRTTVERLSFIASLLGKSERLA
jgi:hypothetical protein